MTATFFAALAGCMFASAWVLTWRIRAYAIARNVLDVPNARSSHVVATPRGGGGAIVLSTLAGLILLGTYRLLSWSTVLGLVGSGALVALIGWLDDVGHIALPWRFVTQFIAGCWLVAWLGGFPPLLGPNVMPSITWFWSGITVFYTVWLINLTNFMDGIDGIAGVEITSISIGALLLHFVVTPIAMLWVVPLIFGSATLGFLVWNWPPAKIFMGDVGSGFSGLMLAALSLQAAQVDERLFWSFIILLGVFICDATVTLIRRMMRGDKFYEPHRTHAYQHAALRCGAHYPVTLAVGAINLFWLLPVAGLVAAGILNPSIGLFIAYGALISLILYLRAGEPSLA